MSNAASQNTDLTTIDDHHHVKPIKGQLLLQANATISCQLDGKGKTHPITSHTEATTKNPCWLHLDFSDPKTIDWINHTTLIPDLAKKELLKPNQSPKEIRFDSGILIVLKGVNFTPNTLPDPIVTFRFYITDNLIISTRRQHIEAIVSLKDKFEKGIGPVDVADWLIQVVELISDQVNQSFDSVYNVIAKYEDKVFKRKEFARRDIGHIHKQLIILRRLLVPQRDILVRVAAERISWIDNQDRQLLQNISIQQSHYIDDIDGCLNRLSALLDLINNIIAESTNKRIYLMTIFTIIFTPITFITSLLGVNLAGIPFSSHEWSFTGIVLIILIVCIGSVVWLKFKKWL
ncbi:zinc transporter ZntB [Orbaceae bacterium ac157xtp]